MPSTRPRPPRAALAAGLVLAATAATASVALAPAAAAAPTCSDVELVVAGGVNEPGTLGQHLGDPLLEELKDALPGRITGHRVDVPNALGFSNTIQGAKNIVTHIEDRLEACPDQLFVLAGYSAGAPAVDHALGADGTVGGPASLLPEAALWTVGAVTLFGDPNQSRGQIIPPTWQPRTKRWCMPADPYCQPGLLNGNLNPFSLLNYLNGTANLKYGREAAPEAAEFVASLLLRD